MKLNHLSSHDAMTVLEIVHDSLTVSNSEQFQTLLLRLRELLPYQASIAGLTGLDAKGMPGEFTIVNVEYPDEYLTELWRSGIIWQDPILVENFHHYRLQYWADTFKKRPVLKANVDLCKDFGFRHGAQGQGYGHGIRNRSGTRGSIFCWHSLKRDPRTEEVISLVVPHFHEALIRIGGDSLNHIQLTPREQEVLQWLANGKNTWDISVILAISERTVKFHIARIFQKLGATTRAHAVALAFKQELIEIN